MSDATPDTDPRMLSPNEVCARRTEAELAHAKSERSTSYKKRLAALNAFTATWEDVAVIVAEAMDTWVTSPTEGLLDPNITIPGTAFSPLLGGADLGLYLKQVQHALQSLGFTVAINTAKTSAGKPAGYDPAQDVSVIIHGY